MVTTGTGVTKLKRESPLVMERIPPRTTVHNGTRSRDGDLKRIKKGFKWSCSTSFRGQRGLQIIRQGQQSENRSQIAQRGPSPEIRPGSQKVIAIKNNSQEEYMGLNKFTKRDIWVREIVQRIG